MARGEREDVERDAFLPHDALETEPTILRTTSSRGNFLQRLLSRNTSVTSYFAVPTDLDEDGFSDDKESVVAQTRGHHRWVPEEEAGVFSTYTFGWVTGILSLGLTKHLEQCDLWDTAEVDDVWRVSLRFERNLSSTKDFDSPSGRMASALWRTHRKRFVFAGCIKLFHDCFLFANPLLLEALLKHLAAGGARWVGVLLALALAASSVVQTLAINAYFHVVFRLCAQVKTQLVGTLYDKSLRIDSSEKSSMGVGAIVNLQSNDAAKLYKLPQYLHMLWSAPFQIFMVMAMLIRVLHPIPALVGLAVTVALIPLSSLVARALAKARTRIVKLTDERVKLSSEVILGIKAIKLYAWEEAYSTRILALREKELAAIRFAALIGLWNSMLWLGGPILISMAAFFTYTWMGYELEASIAFPALSLFNLLRFPVMMLPTQLENIINANVAMKRIQGFMEKEEMKTLAARSRASTAGTSNRPIGNVRICGSFGWGGEDLLTLDIKVDAGSLAMVVGEVGSGKSSLLLAVLGEMRARGRHDIDVNGTMAYTQQDPWIQNMSLRDNILLGRAYDQTRYQRVIHACALEPDLRILPAGDMTEIGEKGVNLSGGQRHRVALARACYQEADIYLLDDPLSAVDAEVGRHLMDHCITGLLSGKTIILVTHQLQYLPQSSAVMILEGGKVADFDTYANLVAKGVDFHQFEGEHHDEGVDEEENVDGGSDVVEEDDVGDAGDVVGDTTKANEAIDGNQAGDANIGADNAENKLERAALDERRKKITKAEERAVGQVKREVYRTYFSVWGTRWLPGLLLPLMVLSLAFLEKGLQSGQSWWLSVWSAGVESAPASEEQDEAWYYMKIYFFIGLVALIATVARQVSLVLGALVAAGNLQRSLLETVLGLPMSFFDSQPTGRLLNRFTKDIEAVDTSLQASLSSFLSCSVSVVWSLIVVVIVTPAIAVAFLPITFAYAKIQNMYVSTSRELKRLDSLAMSPIFSIFSETLLGLTTVRAFRVEDSFRTKAGHFLEESNRCFWPIQCVNRWLSIRLELTGTFIVLSSAVVCSVFDVSAGLAGLAVSSALNLSGLMSWMVRQTTELEVNMNSVERLVEYDDTPREAPAVIPERRPLPAWPTRGEIVIEDLQVRYRPDLDLVLRGVSFQCAAGEKIGIVGRTGCGKSTLLSAILRIIEPCGGKVIIDGIDVATIGLRDLRSRISLVAQDCVLFAGSIRSNLDPFSMAASDDVIWDALTAASLRDTVQAMGGLDASVSESGGNLSQGQRQLVSLARALLRNSRILILDEATSSIDTATDALIQKTIRTSFADSTTLTIAHRIHTIIDSDKILVLDAGAVAEFGPPSDLMLQGKSFSKLLASANSKSKRNQTPLPPSSS